jgi:hypothetical protein
VRNEPDRTAQPALTRKQISDRTRQRERIRTKERRQRQRQRQGPSIAHANPDVPP